MSYDELLAKFTRPEAKVSSRALALALYAVVELHQRSPGWGKELEFICSECSRVDLMPYPCPTIRDIEKVFALPGMELSHFGRMVCTAWRGFRAVIAFFSALTLN